MTLHIKRVLQILGLLVVALMALSPAFGADLFVDSTGAGGAYTTIQAAFTAAGANDTIWVRGGQTFNGMQLSWGATQSGVKIYGGWNGNTTSPSSNAFTMPTIPRTSQTPIRTERARQSGMVATSPRSPMGQTPQ